MTSAAKVEDFRASEAQLNETGQLLGEMSALLADAAECLSHDPVRFATSIRADEWPTFDRVQALVASWLKRRDRLRTVWLALSAEDRGAVGALPDFDASDPSLAVV